MPDTIFQFLCRRATEHRWRKLTAYSVGIEPVEYHYTCRLCRKHFWNYSANPGELRRLNRRILNREVKNSIRKKRDNCEQEKPYPQEQANVRIEEGEE